MTIPRLMWIADCVAAPQTPDFEKRLEEACQAGLQAVQLRDRMAPAKQIYETALWLRSRTTILGIQLIINERVDIALAVKADGLHMLAGGLTPQQIRLCGFDRVIGVSVHAPREAILAAEAGAHYAQLGPIFETPNKEAIGLSPLREASAFLPIIAIGGISPANKHTCLAAGAHGVAAIRSFQGDVYAWRTAIHR